MDCSSDENAGLVSATPAWIGHLRALVHDDALEGLRQPLTLLFGAVAQHPSDLIPLTHHFIVSLRPELGSPVLARLATAVTLFLVEADEDIDFSRYRETFWYFAWLKDFRNVTNSVEQLVLLVAKGRDLHIRRRGLKLLYGSLLGQYSEQLANLVLQSHITDLVGALQPYVDRYHVLMSSEIAMASKFIRLFREITNQVRVDVDKTMSLIAAVIPVCLALLKTAGSSTPLRHHKKYFSLVRDTLYLIARICGSDPVCLDFLSTYQPTRAVLPLLDCKDVTVVDAAWFAMNWCIISDASKIDFIATGGAERIFYELEKPVLVSRSVIYCARKLAMLQETRRKLIECNTVPVLLSFKRKNGDIEAAFVTALTLSFMVLEREEPWQSAIALNGAPHELLELVTVLYKQATARSLGVLYVQLNHARMLVESGIYEAQCYGVWWVLHLLYGQTHGFYSRSYGDMAFRDRVVPALFGIVKEASQSIEKHFLLQMACEALALISEDPKQRMPLVDCNVFGILNELCMLPSSLFAENAFTAGMATVKNLLEDPSVYSYQEPSTLRQLCANQIFTKTDKASVLAALELAHSHDFWRMKAVFLARLFCDRIADHNVLLVFDDELSGQIASIATAKKQYGRCALSEIMQQLVDDQPVSVDAVNAVLKLCVQNDAITGAERLIDAMNTRNIVPNAETVNLCQQLSKQRN